MNIKNEIEKRAEELNRIKRKIFILQFIKNHSTNVTQELKEFGVSKSTYYGWKKKFELEGKKGLKKKKAYSLSPPK